MLTAETEPEGYRRQPSSRLPLSSTRIYWACGVPGPLDGGASTVSWADQPLPSAGLAPSAPAHGAHGT